MGALLSRLCGMILFTIDKTIKGVLKCCFDFLRSPNLQNLFLARRGRTKRRPGARARSVHPSCRHPWALWLMPRGMQER